MLIREYRTARPFVSCSRWIAGVAALSAACLWSMPAVAAATDGMALAKARNCMACHQVDRKRVGPAYEAVARKYGQGEAAQAALAQSIRKGSVRKWGAVPMPAQPRVSEAEAQQLAAWILGLGH